VVEGELLVIAPQQVLMVVLVAEEVEVRQEVLLLNQGLPIQDLLLMLVFLVAVEGPPPPIHKFVVAAVVLVLLVL
jgi:hypothetical protein